MIKLSIGIYAGKGSKVVSNKVVLTKINCVHFLSNGITLGEYREIKMGKLCTVRYADT